MADFILRRRGLVGLVCLAVLVAALPLAARQSTNLKSGGFLISGSQSSNVNAALARYFPQDSRSDLAVLLWPRSGSTTAEYNASITKVERALPGIPHLRVLRRDLSFVHFAAGLHEPLLLPLHVSGDEDAAQEIAETLRQRLHLNDPTSGRIETHLLGEGALSAGLEDTLKRDLSRAELIGIPLILIVLVVTFGSPWASVLPLILGAVAVAVTGALIYLISLVTEMSVFVTDTASMLGIGVAVDYSLIIVGRVRQELDAGHDIQQACALALKTSGRAVTYSGGAVVASLAGLWVVPCDALQSLALGAILVVAVSVLVSVTLLPVLISFLGASRLSRGLPVRLPRLAGRRQPLGSHWAVAVLRRPVTAAAVIASVLVVLCIPVFNLKMGTGPLRQLGTTNETRVGFDEAAKLAGPGALGPIDIVIRAPDPNSRRDLTLWYRRLANRIKRLPDIRQVSHLELSRTAQLAYFTATPNTDPESPAAEDLARRLRLLLSGNLRGTPLQAEVGGTSATQLDAVNAVSSSMGKVLILVLLIELVILTVLLRSIVLPLMTALLNLLSVGAAYGVLIAVFQFGWLAPPLGIHPIGHLEILTPPLILAVVFGLSMDYQVFLLVRIQEEWIRSGDPQEAIRRGLSGSARTISSAALILVCVFLVFAATGVLSITELGLGAAVAIALDATLIRLALMPALMQLIGTASWWTPRRRTATA
jgi:uncharacterized membrane protein YdfJ with MMPL/SSD domain